MSEKGRDKAPKRKGGKPTVRTPEVENLIFRALGVGLSNENAARMAGIGASTLDDWLRDDAGFRAACEKVRTEPAYRCAHSLLQQAEKGNVTAAIFWLKCRAPEFREPKETVTEEIPDPDARFE